MGWFKYLKASEVPGLVNKNTNFSFPAVRRKIGSFTPRDTLSDQNWLTVDVSGLNIDKFYNGIQQNVVTDEGSYLVVYEPLDLDSEDLTVPVPCVIEDDILYFKAAETHLANVPTSGEYYLYYRTPNIRYVKSTLNGPGIDDADLDSFVENEIFEYYKENRVFDFFVQDPADGVYNVDPDDVDRLTFRVDLDSSNSYNFSFVNGEQNWVDGATLFAGSKLYLTFSGPSLELVGDRGPNFSKVALKLVRLDSSSLSSSQVVFDNLILDLYSLNSESDVVIYSVDDLTNDDYSLEILVLNDRNILSGGNEFKVSFYRFNYDLGLSVGKEELFDQNVFNIINRAPQSSFGGSGLITAFRGPVGPTGPPAVIDGFSVVIQDTKPIYSDNTLWYESDTGDLYISYDNYWVQVNDGMGPTGPAGVAGDTGVVVGPTPPSDTSVLWIDTSEPGSAVLPLGGLPGQVLVKNTSSDYDTGWVTSFSNYDVLYLWENYR